MKLVRFGEQGREKPGILDRDGNIRDLSSVIPDIGPDAVTPEGLKRIRQADPEGLPLAARGARLGACIGAIGKLIGIGLNYVDHAKEVGKPLPTEPAFFLKATSSIVGPNDPLEIPPESLKSDWEVELGVIIGKTAKRVDAANALQYVAGYCTAADFSERHFQGLGGPTYGKSFDTFGPIGPWLVTADEVANPHDLRLTCDVDGDRRQDGSTANLVFNVPTIIAHLSRYFSLHPGDVIITGTPAGVGSGRKPQLFLKAGETIRLEVQGLGVQEHKSH
jgi:2-keto-4-pentenoate hydratase/2-oxohepta-3-ene-1,7-dioic acid hydratase in catechol pathway